MAYLDQRMGAGRVTSIVMVGVLHALLGYMLVTGMAYKVVKKAVEDLKTFDVNEEPPPPEEKPPPPPEKVPDLPPPPTTPPPLNKIPPVSAPPIVAPPTPPVLAPPPPAPPPPPPPPPPKIQPARAKGSLIGLFSADDYPDSALQREEQGTTRVSFTVGPNGRVSNCQVTQSSGSSSLDSATCRIITSRARYAPATDETGSAVASQQTSPPIRWVLPRD